VDAVVTLIYYLLLLFLFLLIGRLILEYVFLFARNWRPQGPVVILLELIYSVTDPPLKALRRVIPPLRLGSFSLDLAFFVLFILVNVALSVLPT